MSPAPSPLSGVHRRPSGCCICRGHRGTSVSGIPEAERLAALLPYRRLQVIAAGNHDLASSHAEAVADRIDDHLFAAGDRGVPPFREPGAFAAMAKSTLTYWNPLLPESAPAWSWVEGLEGRVEELTLSLDPVNGEITRLTRFLPGADTAAFGAKSHDYPEEVFVVSGRLYDEAFACWLEAGHYASRPPGERHGPFRSDEGCLVLEVSFPQRKP